MKVIKTIINSCINCPNIVMDCSPKEPSGCAKVLDEYNLPKGIDDIHSIPEWCPLEGYKESDTK